MEIIKTAIFKYPDNEVVKELAINYCGDKFLMSDLVAALGINRSKFYSSLKKNEISNSYYKFSEGRGRPSIYFDSETLIHWLNGLNPNYFKNKSLIEHFKTYLPPFIEDIVRQEKQEFDKKVKEAELLHSQVMRAFDYQVEEWDEQRIQNFLSQNESSVIYINHEYTAVQHLRADLVALGVRNVNELNFIVDMPFLHLLSLNKKDSEDEPIRTYLFIDNYVRGDLQKQAKLGYHPEPIFWRKYPDLYKPKSQYTRIVHSNGSMERNGRCTWEEKIIPLGNSPFYEDDFVAEIVRIRQAREDAKWRQAERDLRRQYGF